MGILDDIRGSAIDTLTNLAERLGGGVSPSDDEMQALMRKAGFEPGQENGFFGRKGEDQQQDGVADPTDEKPRGMFHDPYAIVDWGGWRERPSNLTYETLRSMAAQNTVIGSIIQLRTWQISQFAKPQQGKYEKGYKIILRDRRDKKKAMTPVQQRRADELERMLETTGILQPNQKPSSRDSFKDFLKKGVNDILTYDQWCFEKIRDRRGRISQIIALPSETIRPAVVDTEHLDPEEASSRVSHVQVYEDTVVAEFSPEDIAFAVMNPRSDLRVNGFGYSPIEKLIRLVTAWLFGFEYNQRFFSQGSAIKGLLNIKGAIPDRQLRAFRRMWYSQISGVTNAWRTPILNSDDIQWVSMHSNNREMEYAAWMDWLTKLICAMYGVDPVEINFQFGNTGQKSTLNEGSQAEKTAESKDKGLTPLMEHIEDTVNRHIVWELEQDFEFAFTGKNEDSEEKTREARIKEVGAYRMVDEVRADDGEDPLPNGLGQVINNSTWLQFAQAKEQAAQMAAQGGMPGAPGGPPGVPGEEPPPIEGGGDEEPLYEPGQGIPQTRVAGFGGEGEEEAETAGQQQEQEETGDGVDEGPPAKGKLGKRMRLEHDLRKTLDDVRATVRDTQRLIKIEREGD